MGRCVSKLRHASDDNKPYFKCGVRASTYVSLMDEINSMSMEHAKRRVSRIATDSYVDTPYSNMNMFVKDVAALAKMFPSTMRKRHPKNGNTVRSSLVAATSPMNLEYLQNIGRFRARNPRVHIERNDEERSFSLRDEIIFSECFLPEQATCKVHC